MACKSAVKAFLSLSLSAPHARDAMVTSDGATDSTMSNPIESPRILVMTAPVVAAFLAALTKNNFPREPLDERGELLPFARSFYMSSACMSEVIALLFFR
jgi:hypothetical protein